MVAIVIVLMAGSGTVFAASKSMPDGFLYPVKLTTENVQMFFTFSTLGKAELYAKLADNRVDEIVYMADEGKPEKIELTVQRLDNHLTGIADLAMTEQTAGEAALAPASGKSALDEEAMEAEVVTVPQEEEEIVEEPPTPTEPPAPPPPIVIEEMPLMTERTAGVYDEDVEIDNWSQLRDAVSQDAVNQTARLRKLLETASPSVKSALQEAISVSEIGYEKALASLN